MTKVTCPSELQLELHVMQLRNLDQPYMNLAERYYVTFGLSHEPSVCRPSAALLNARHGLELFGNIFTQLSSSGFGQFLLIFWAKIRRGSRRSCKLNTKRCFSTNIFNFGSGT